MRVVTNPMQHLELINPTHASALSQHPYSMTSCTTEKEQFGGAFNGKCRSVCGGIWGKLSGLCGDGFPKVWGNKDEEKGFVR
jgi:hypothetical protein